MTRLASLSCSAGYAAVVLALASACGGQSFNGAGGEAGSGAAAQGGATSTAGKTSAGGKASAGSASGGNAGAGNEACDAPPTAGDVGCEAAFQRWHHDPTTGICRPIWYGGCGATKNNYETLAECQKACPGGSPNYDACQVATDCIVVGTGCCGVCDGPDLGAHDLIANNKQFGVGLACGGGPVPGAAGNAAPTDAPIACASCAAPAPGTGSLKYFVPNCVQGECVVEDIRDTAVAACKIDADCRLRNGTSCCEGCTSDDLVAVRSDGSFEKQVCGDVLPPCLACVPGKPANAVASCGPAGHCIVNYALSGTDSSP